MQDTLYVFNKYNAYVYTGGNKQDKFTRLSGYNAPADIKSTDRVVSVGKFEEDKLYVISETKIEIYQISPDSVEKLSLYKSFDDLKMGSFTPIATHYDPLSRTFFLTTFGFVYTVEINDITADPTIRIL